MDISLASSWTLKTKLDHKSEEFIKSSSCPRDDDHTKISPWSVTQANSNNAHAARTDGHETRLFYVYIPPQLCSSILAKPSRYLTDYSFHNSHEQKISLSTTIPERSTRNGKQTPQYSSIEAQYGSELSFSKRATKKSSPMLKTEARPLRIILAFHGYGGNPRQEITKWKNIAASIDSIIIAPKGTITASSGKLGWNAVDCCGDPVTNDVNDQGFITGGGVLDVFLAEIQRIPTSGDDHSVDHVIDGPDSQTNPMRNGVNVIATGFSNGGFFSSLLGLLPSTERPWWLRGIVPMGGYQYDLSLYGNFGDDHLDEEDDAVVKPNPLPIMSYHGGRDSVVKPEGCCKSAQSPSTNSKSNCPFDIGAHQKTCTSVHSAFEMWSIINKCNSTSPMIQENKTGDGKIIKSEKKRSCWIGNKCVSSTVLCVWNDEGHSWGKNFPGVYLAQDWMEQIFVQSEKMSINGNAEIEGEIDAAVFDEIISLPGGNMDTFDNSVVHPRRHSTKIHEYFLALLLVVLTMLAVVACCVVQFSVFNKMCCFMLAFKTKLCNKARRRKRKISSDIVLSKEDEEAFDVDQFLNAETDDRTEVLDLVTNSIGQNSKDSKLV